MEKSLSEHIFLLYFRGPKRSKKRREITKVSESKKRKRKFDKIEDHRPNSVDDRETSSNGDNITDIVTFLVKSQ